MAKYCYHDIQHTLNVVRAAGWIGAQCGFSEQELETVQVAAWFHDTGYLYGWEGHEAASAKIADRFLKKCALPPERIKQIKDCILATQMPHKPLNLLEKVICDADLFNLAAPCYLSRALMLKNELERTRNIVQAPLTFLKNEIRFLRGHRYHTDFGRDYLEKRKRRHIATLEEMQQQYSEQADLQLAHT